MHMSPLFMCILRLTAENELKDIAKNPPAVNSMGFTDLAIIICNMRL